MQQSITDLRTRVDELYKLVRKEHGDEEMGREEYGYTAFDDEVMRGNENTMDEEKRVDLTTDKDDGQSEPMAKDVEEQMKEKDCDVSPVKMTLEIVEWLKNKEQAIVIYRGGEQAYTKTVEESSQPAEEEDETRKVKGKGKGKKAEKKETKGGKKRKKKEDEENVNVIERPKRNRRGGRTTSYPCTDKFGSNDKSNDGPKFHVLTPPMQKE